MFVFLPLDFCALRNFFHKQMENFRFIFLNHAEIIVHDFFGDREYWKCRRSMQFSDQLKLIASIFKNSALIFSTDEKTVNIAFSLPHKN